MIKNATITSAEIFCDQVSPDRQAINLMIDANTADGVENIEMYCTEERLIRFMNICEVTFLDNAPGKTVRLEYYTDGGISIERIGHPIKDKWLRIVERNAKNL